MNSFRHLTVVGILTIGIIRPGVSTTFTDGLNWCPEKSPCTSLAPKHAGETTYRPDPDHRNYQIHNRTTDGSPVAGYFYHPQWDHSIGFVDFKTCRGDDDPGCQVQPLPKDAKGTICMKTGVKNGSGDDNQINNYIYGDQRCFVVNS